MLHGFLPSLIEGAGTTLAVAICSLVVAVLLGLAGALMKLSHSRLLQSTATVYTTLIAVCRTWC